MARVDPTFIEKVKNLGAFDITACYNCGNCTAICPLSSEGHEFPRKLIRYSMLGMENRIISAPELWLCYYCGECTDTCPRQADPGGLMMALRRYAISKYSVGRIAGLFYNRVTAALSWIILSLIALIGLLMFMNPNVSADEMRRSFPFCFIEKGFIHDAGLILGAIVIALALANLYIMYKSISLGYSRKTRGSIGLWTKSLVLTLINEVAAQLRYTKCENKFRYIGHMSLFWGFVGLFIATITGFLRDFYDIIIPPEVSLGLGVVFGILLLYGSLYYMVGRFSKREAYAKYSHHTDWVFLWLLFLTGITGFLVTIFRFMEYPFLTYAFLLIHLVVVFDLLITAPFTKFSHAIFRPLAIWLSSTMDQLAQEASKEATS